MKSKELREKRAKLIRDARALVDKAAEEKRELTSEESAQFDKMFADADELKGQIDRVERLETEERDLDQPLRETRAGRENPEPDTPANLPPGAAARLRPYTTAEYRQAFLGFLTRGLGGLTAAEARSLSAGNDSEGGYLRAPIQFVQGLIKAVDDMVWIRQLSSKETVVEAAGLGVMSLDSDPADADWTSEVATGSETDMTFGGREMYPHPLAKRIKVSNKLIRQVPSIEALVQMRLAYKFGVSQEKAFLTGHGASQPLGVFTASTKGISTARDVTYTASDDETKIDSFKDAKYTLKGGYWGRATWLMHRDMVKTVAKLKDGNNRYYWEDSIVQGDPDRLLGFPTRMSEFAPNTISAGNYVAILGDFSYYKIVDALSMTVQRLVELYAETNQTGYIGRLETDGQPVLEEAFVRLKHA